MKRPSFQFYPADWRKDAALQSCSLPAQGLWVNLMCIAHECEPYGHLLVNGKPMTPAQIGRLVGISAKDADKLLAELADAGVSSTDEKGAIFSRRMVRDEDLRNRRAEGGKAGSEHGAKGAEHGSKGGRPKKVRGVSEPPIEPPPSSSSSSSSSFPSETQGAHGPSLAAGSASEAAALASVEGIAPTPAGAICRAMRLAGMADTNPGDPRLLALIAQGATLAEFAGVAADAVAKSRGWAWALVALEGRRRDAAAISLAAAVETPEAIAARAAAAEAERTKAYIASREIDPKEVRAAARRARERREANEAARVAQ